MGNNIKKTNKKYEIETFEQLVNIVNIHNINNIIVDFATWITQTNTTFENIKKNNPQYKDKLNSEIAKVKFIWIDDGKTGLVDIQLKNKDTGEIKHLKPKKK